MKIEKGIPVPGRRAESCKYPFTKLEVGDSFLVPEGLDMAMFRSASSYAGKRNSKTFTTRKIEGGRYRCWRIK